MDLIAPHSEEIIPQHIEGAYNGVHDIEIIDDNNFVCAQYDGSIIYFSLKSFFDETEFDFVDFWKVANVVKPHNDWVWNVVKYGEWDNEHHSVISCSYDETVRITDLVSPSRTTLIIIGKDQQPIRGLCMTSDSKLWAFSYNYIFSAYINDQKWKIDEPFFTGNRIISAIFDDGTDCPCVFYNTGSGTQGYIARYHNGDLSEIIKCEGTASIRKAKVLERNSKKYLVVAGTKDNSSYVAVYGFNKETNNYDDSPAPSRSCVVSMGKGVNDFDIVEINSKVLIILVNVNHTIVICNLSDEMGLTVREKHFITEDQPMCIAANNNYALVGLLNGKILKLSIDICTDGSDNDFDFSISDFVTTHANLYSTYKVDLSDAVISDPDLFKSQLGCYFLM